MDSRTARMAIGMALSLLAVSCGSIWRAGGGAGAPSSPVSAKAAPSPARSRDGRTPTSSRGGAPCQAGDLALGYSPEISPATEEHGDIYMLVNRGRSACALAGYPGITLYDPSGAVLRFHYMHGGQFTTTAPPATVLLRPAASAYVLVEQSACEMGDEEPAVTIRISMPRPSGATVAGRAWSEPDGASQLWYCRGGTDGVRLPVFVSPIEPTRAATVMPAPEPGPA